MNGTLGIRQSFQGGVLSVAFEHHGECELHPAHNGSIISKSKVTELMHLLTDGSGSYVAVTGTEVAGYCKAVRQTAGKAGV